VIEYRCRNPHPKFDGQECGKLVAIDRNHSFIGQIEAWCPRCEGFTMIDARETAATVDSPAVMV